ncbi:MAG: leucyl aminopeptidase [Ignavibacteria bacterium]|jgi:leucyl aminopeptidase|nr:leucyl aminopeptidase [Ignavibacteria bacterium]MDH7527876.1 leucyl aminopeptidase [Ignavibacteria bacterium]
MIKFETLSTKGKKLFSRFEIIESFLLFSFSEKESIEETLTKFSTLANEKLPKKLQSIIESTDENPFQFNLKDGRLVILQKVGERKKLNPDTFRRAAASLAKKLSSLKITDTLVIPVDLSDEEITQNFKTHDYYIQSYLEGFKLGAYKYQDYLQKKNKSEISIKIYYPEISEDRLKEIYTNTETLMKYVYLARDLQNKPSNELTPKKFVEIVKDLTRKNKNVKLKVFDFEQIKKMKMGGLEAVGKGSDNPPYFLILEYNGNPQSKDKTVLVGKGITFDSGGISLKPASGMWEMKGDMSGAAAVVSSIFAAAELNLKSNLMGLVPLAENMPSGKSMKPGDIIKTASGKTIEIDNTDAEGRLILADALEYASKYKPKVVIDLATLTGACVVALGQFAAGLFTRSDELACKLTEAGNLTSEKVWRLPLWDDYHSLIKSNFADVKNVGGRWAGAITAACFLEKFVDQNYQWAHLDIAGPAFQDDNISYNSKTMTGYGVRLLIEYLKQNS